MKALLGLLLLNALPVLTAPTEAKPTSAAQSARLMVEMKRQTAAYEKLGDFKVASLDMTRENGVTRWVISTAFVARDGRMGFKKEELGGPGKAGRVLLAKLFDGKELIQSLEGGPETRLSPAELRNNRGALVDFFLGSVGLRFVVETARFKSRKSSDWSAPVGQYLFRKLPQGKLQIENISQKSVGDFKADFVTLINVRVDGTIERVVATVKAKGKELFYSESDVGQPIRLTAKDAFQWSKFSPRSNSN